MMSPEEQLYVTLHLRSNHILIEMLKLPIGYYQYLIHFSQILTCPLQRFYPTIVFLFFQWIFYLACSLRPVAIWSPNLLSYKA